jgi:peptidoglycan/LPS O-acetylase OafA/YrhL
MTGAEDEPAARAAISPSQSTYLDLLRGVSSQFVLLGHALSYLGYQRILHLQNLGVEIFFLLSGFLIVFTTLKKRERGPYPIGRFIEDRVFRIYTPFLPALVFIVAVDLTVYHVAGAHNYEQNLDVKSFVVTLLMLEQYPINEVASKLLGLRWLDFQPFGSARILWSVAQEFWLYLLFAYVFFVGPRLWQQGTNLKLWAGLMFFALVPAYNAVTGVAPGISFDWLLGAAAAAVAFHRPALLARLAKNRPVLAAVLALVLLAIAVRIADAFLFRGANATGFRFYDLITTVLGFSAIACVYLLVEKTRLPAWLVTAAAFLASYSYSLYLVHLTMLIAFELLQWETGNGWWDFAFYMLAPNAVALLLYLAFERHYKAVQHWARGRFSFSR